VLNEVQPFLVCQHYPKLRSIIKKFFGSNFLWLKENLGFFLNFELGQLIVGKIVKKINFNVSLLIGTGS